MSLSADAVVIALQARQDDRGYIRTTIDQIVGDTQLSRSTVKRSLSELSESCAIRVRVKDGRDGGLLIRMETGSQTGSKPVHKPVQNEPVDHVVIQTPGPEGALGGLYMTSETGSPSTASRGFAYRPAGFDETPESGAEIVYTNDGLDGWKYLNATSWIAPNGDLVSVKSMTPNLRRRLGI